MIGKPGHILLVGKGGEPLPEVDIRMVRQTKKHIQSIIQLINNAIDRLSRLQSPVEKESKRLHYGEYGRSQDRAFGDLNNSVTAAFMKTRDQPAADFPQNKISPAPGAGCPCSQCSDRHITQPCSGESLYHLFPLPGLICTRSQMLYGTAAADHEMLAGSLHPLGCWLHQFDQIADDTRATIRDRAHPDPFARQGKGNEKRP